MRNGCEAFGENVQFVSRLLTVASFVVGLSFPSLLGPNARVGSGNSGPRLSVPVSAAPGDHHLNLHSPVP